MQSALKQYWWQLSVREQRLVMLMGGLLVLLLLWLALIRPLLKAHQAAERRLAHAQTQWHWLNAQLAAHPELLQKQQPLTHAQLKTWLQGILQQYAIDADVNLSPQGLSVRFTAPPQVVAIFLNQLQRPGLQVVQLNISKQSDHRVQVVLVLRGLS